MGVWVMRHTVTNQQEMNVFLNNDAWSLEKLNINFFGDNNSIFLDGDYFVVDCSCKLFTSYASVIFIGRKGTKIKFTNCKIGTPSVFYGFDQVVDDMPIFTSTHHIIFQNVYITSDQFVEIGFEDREELNTWKNVSYDTSRIRVVITSEETDKFLSQLDSYNVEGILEIGDQVVVNRGIYTHHGVYVEHNRIIHYSGEPGIEGVVSEISLDDFAKDDQFWVYNHSEKLSVSEIVSRARSRLYERNYNLVFNNCEHFAQWCCTGTAWSNQVFGGLLFGNIVNDGGAKKYRLQK
jgi:hypothetical protein